MSSLLLVRHGESEWNKKGIWTGLTDIPLSAKGIKEAKGIAKLLAHIHIDASFTSTLSRAKETLSIIKNELHLQDLITVESAQLNERDYGVYTGKNKWEVKEALGETEFKKLRRSWNYPISQGESLKQVSERVIPYFTKYISPFLRDEKCVLIVAHGNSIRTIVKYIEHISDSQIADIEIATGQLWKYTLGDREQVISKEILPKKENTS